MNSKLLLPRREFLSRSAHRASAVMLATAFYNRPGLFAEQLLTPSMTEGPFYPDKLPLDTDNDLLILNDAITPAVGTITHLTGKILDRRGNPVRNARVEIWQCDAQGVYLHSRGGSRQQRDTNFQGFGRFTTGINGEYYFRTIKPVSYPGRTPHIHFAVYINHQRRLTTQMFINGHPQNGRDGLVRSIADPAARNSLMVDFQPLENSTLGELTANFDLILGWTPGEPSS